jgi:hypothetical protein
MPFTMEKISALAQEIGYGFGFLAFSNHPAGLQT